MVKTTLDIPDELLAKAKALAGKESLGFLEFVAQGLVLRLEKGKSLGKISDQCSRRRKRSLKRQHANQKMIKDRGRTGYCQSTSSFFEVSNNGIIDE